MELNAIVDVGIAVLGGAVRVGTPFLFVSLGECLTEKSGRINLGLEGVLVLAAMAGFAGSYLSGSPWLGVLAAGASGALLALLHGLLCSLPRVSDVATGIALMLFGAGLAFFLGKPLIQPQAPQVPALALGGWSESPAVQSALAINALFPLGVLLALLLHWGLANTRWGLIVRMAGTRPTRRARWATRSTACALPPPRPAASSPGWAARRCRCSTPAAGTRACPAARA